MKRARARSIVSLALLVVWGASWADPSTPSDPKLAGKTAVEMVQTDGRGIAVPLRHANIISGSESLALDGKPLRKDQDYVMDYARGLVYLTHGGSAKTLRATYRWDPDAKASASTESNALGALGGFGLHVLGGDQKILLGLGMAERTTEGTVLQTNLIGMKNKFGLQGGSIDGIVVAAERQNVRSSSLLDREKTAAAADAGKSQAVLQNLSLGFFGGKVRSSYQDISAKFSGFQAMRDAGMDAGRVDALAKEKGLKRMGLGLTGIGGKALGLSTGYDVVRDGKKAIEWRSIGLNTGTIMLQWQGTKVDSNFNRFRDLSNEDRNQLAQEAGINRENMTGGIQQRGLGLKFQSDKVESNKGQGLYRRKADLTIGGLGFGFTDQRVEAGFDRFGATRMADAGQLARERGLRRQSMSLNYAGKGAPKLDYQTSWLRSNEHDSARFATTLLQLTGDRWSIWQAALGADAEFKSMGSMDPNEVQRNIGTVATMLGSQNAPRRGEEPGLFLQNPGIQREATRIEAQPLKGLGISANQFDVHGKTDGANLQQVALNSKGASFAISNLHVGKGFSELGSTLILERDRLGILTDLRRQDVTLSLRGRGTKALDFGQTRASRGGEGDLLRQTLRVTDKNFAFSANLRNIDTEFTSIGQFQDPEHDLLTQNLGFRQQDESLAWKPLRGLDLKLNQARATNDSTGEDRSIKAADVSYALDAKTQLRYVSMDSRTANPDELLYENVYRRWSVSRNFGRLGRFWVEQESIDYAGSQTQLPDSERKSLGYETELSKTTSLRAEQTNIQYSDGQTEQANTRTISTSLDKRTGVTLSDSSLKRSGDRPDERKRQVGFWWDFGNGMRFSYNYGRQANTAGPGTEQSSFQLTPGQIGGIAVGSAMYQENVWDRQRFQSTGNIQVNTVKPLQIGALRDLTMKYGADTVRDNQAFQRENRTMGAGFRLGEFGFGWDYLSQVGIGGVQAIDRTFRFTTDPSPNKPFKASVTYKLRTMPNDQRTMIRNYSLSARLARNMELSHSLITNPEVARADVLLGSLPQASRQNRWKLDFGQASQSNRVAATFDEFINDQARTRSRVGGLNLTLNAKSASPVYLFYGVEQNDIGGKRMTQHRYSLRFDQQPGPRQLFSLFVGNVSWQHNRPTDANKQNWSLRLEYQLRF